jgi:FAD/FMN-containing dehydrogenase
MLEAHTTVFEELARCVPAPVYVPGSPDYLSAVTVWNGAVTAQPAAVARPRSSEEVQAILSFAHEHDIARTVRGGGHHWAGRALNDGGPVIDLSGMRRVQVDPIAREADVEGGATADNVVRAAEPVGLTAATGTIGGVGMVGFTLGGGYGPLNGIAGLDNMVEAQVVLADGRSVTANATSEPDLYWALRGGGGNFGVVTRIRVRLHPVAAVITGVILFPWEQAADVLRRYDALVPSMPDHLTAERGHLQPRRSADGVPGADLGRSSRRWPALGRRSEPAGQPHCRAGRADAHQRSAAPARRSRCPRTSLRIAHGQRRRAVDRGHRRSRRRRLNEDQCIQRGFHPPFPRGVDARRSQPHRIRHPGSALRDRNNRGVGIWRRRNAPAGAQDLVDALRADALPGGYPNLIGPAQRSQADAAYGPNAQRLLAVKNQWDRADIFSATPHLSRGEWAPEPCGAPACRYVK